MRIVAGLHRGRVLASPGAAGGGEAHLRPTSDRLRESIFNLLAHGGYADPPLPQGARVLDLFAGTGALGLEALSRGAARAVFIDDLPAARALIRSNVDVLGVIGQVKIWRRDATKLGSCQGEPFDLVFADPPYGLGLLVPALASARAGGWLAPGALIVAETPVEEPPPELSWAELLDRRDYGGSAVSFLRATAGPTPSPAGAEAAISPPDSDPSRKDRP